MTNALNHVYLSVNPAYNEIYGKTPPPPPRIIFPKGSWDLVSISSCHSNSLFGSSKQGLYQVLKQPLRTMFPHITGIYPSCLPPGNAWLQKHCMSKAQRHHTKCKKHKHFSLLKGWVASDLPECSRPPPSFSTELSVLNTEKDKRLGSYAHDSGARFQK